MNYEPHEYQKHVTELIQQNKAFGMFLECGLGKTVITLTAINELLHKVKKVLVIAPLRVAEDTWSKECEKWDHLKHLRISKVLGSEKQRLEALKTKTDIYVINRENVEWLVKLYGKSWPFDMVVVDELSSFKSASSNRFKALRRVQPEMTAKEKALYQQLKRNMLLTFAEGDIDASNAAALSNKLLQMANGAVYDENGAVRLIHHRKLDALETLWEGANGKPILVFYAYKHDKDRITQFFKSRKIKPRELNTSEDITDWNNGNIEVALAHPASAGHGLNLQAGGHIVIWFGLTWSLELYQQANGRLYRQGQNETVIVHHIVTAGTIDEQVISALSRKDTSQAALINAVKAALKGGEQKCNSAIAG